MDRYAAQMESCREGYVLQHPVKPDRDIRYNS